MKDLNEIVTEEEKELINLNEIVVEEVDEKREKLNEEKLCRTK